MARYRITVTWGESFEVEADLAEASAPICLVDDDGELCSTPYQTADARHTEDGLVVIAIQAMGPEWYADPGIDVSHDAQLDVIVEESTITRMA